MRRRHVFLLAIPMIVLVLVLTGWNRTSAEDRPDQSVDFRLSQIMVKLGQIERELSQVKNRLGSQDRRLTGIDRQLERILEEIEEVASTASAGLTASSASSASEASASSGVAASASSGVATDPSLVGTWRLARNDFAEGIPKNIRRYLSAQAERAEQARDRNRADRIERDIEKNVRTVIDSFEVFLDQSGFLLLRFEPDGMYTDSTKDVGMWLISGDRLIMTTFDGRTYPSTYSIDEAGLTLTITGDQIGTLIRLEAERMGAGGRRLIDNTFRYTDRVRLFYTKD